MVRVELVVAARLGAAVGALRWCTWKITSLAGLRQLRCKCRAARVDWVERVAQVGRAAKEAQEIQTVRQDQTARKGIGDRWGQQALLESCKHRR